MKIGRRVRTLPLITSPVRATSCRSSSDVPIQIPTLFEAFTSAPIASVAMKATRPSFSSLRSPNASNVPVVPGAGVPASAICFVALAVPTKDAARAGPPVRLAGITLPAVVQPDWRKKRSRKAWPPSVTAALRSRFSVERNRGRIGPVADAQTSWLAPFAKDANVAIRSCLQITGCRVRECRSALGNLTGREDGRQVLPIAANTPNAAAPPVISAENKGCCARRSTADARPPSGRRWAVRCHRARLRRGLSRRCEKFPAGGRVAEACQIRDRAVVAHGYQLPPSGCRHRAPDPHFPRAHRSSGRPPRRYASSRDDVPVCRDEWVEYLTDSAGTAGIRAASE